MHKIGPFALIAAGILAISGLILSKKPDAKKYIDMLVPYQGFLGVGLLAWGIYDLFVGIGITMLKGLMSRWPVGGVIILAYLVSSILLGFLFGMPLIAKWIPGDSPAEERALKIQQKIGGFSTIIGIVGIAAGVGATLMWFNILKP